VSFCLPGRSGSLDFYFYRLKIYSIKSKKTMCRMCEGTKSMTGKTTEGQGVGKGKKDRASPEV
jgi:hypothetical protein